MAASSRSLAIFVLFVLCALIQVTSAENIIWYNGESDLYVGHDYAWQGTTDNTSTPELLIASVINQPWLVAISKSKNIIYWTDTKGVIGAWNLNSRQSTFVHRFDIGSWNEKSQGPALTGLDLDELNNHLYFSFDRSIYRFNLNQANASHELIATYNNKVFNPRVRPSQELLFFCLQASPTQGTLVGAPLASPTWITTLNPNTSTSISQQLFVDNNKNVLYYNSLSTSSMLGISTKEPFNKVFSSITFNEITPAFFDYNPTTNTFIFSDSQYGSAYVWPVGSGQPTTLYSSPSNGQVTGVKFFNDTHAIVAYQYTYSSPYQGKLILVNINNTDATSVLLQNFGMGTSLLFDEKKCDFYYIANIQDSVILDQVVLRKNINEDAVSVFRKMESPLFDSISGLALDTTQRNLISSQSTANLGVISYVPMDAPNSRAVGIVDALGRSIQSYAVNDQYVISFTYQHDTNERWYRTHDIYYTTNLECSIYLLPGIDISTEWMDNVGHRIIEGITCPYGSQMTVDSANERLYYSYGSMSIAQANLDGSESNDIHVFNDGSTVASMSWDPSTERLFVLTTDGTTWRVLSMDGDGTSIIATPLDVSWNRESAQIKPDPLSDWVYLNVDLQPLRIKKDGSSYERLFAYVPYNFLGSIAFNAPTGDIFYGDTQDIIKKVNIHNLNQDDPAATNVDLVWQGDYNNFELQNFILDQNSQMLWILQNNKSASFMPGAPYDRHTLSVTPVKGGQAKELFTLPKGVHYPWTIDTRYGKLYAFSYSLSNDQNQTPALVVMDLYNGSNLMTLKTFPNSPYYPSIVPTAITIDPHTGLLYYALEGNKLTIVERFDPVTVTTKNLIRTDVSLAIKDIQTNGTALFLAPTVRNVLIYDIATQNVQYLPTVASSIALVPKTNHMYFASGAVHRKPGSGYISVMRTDDYMGYSIDILVESFQIDSIAFDFDNKAAYFSLNTGGKNMGYQSFYRSELDGKNKKIIRFEMSRQNSRYLRLALGGLSFVNGKLYSSDVKDPQANSLDIFRVNGTGYQRIIQSTNVKGAIQYNKVSQRVYWQEHNGSRFYSCAVYSSNYADCNGYLLYSELDMMAPTIVSFAVADTGMVYLADKLGSIYLFDTAQGEFSFKQLVRDSRLKGANSIVLNQKQSELIVLVVSDSERNIVSVSLDGQTISTVYKNISKTFYLLAADLEHCK